jgi:hypothetical protein
LILHLSCTDHHETEKLIIKHFDIAYINRRDIGREYYEGNHNKMKEDIYLIVNNGEDYDNFKYNLKLEI